MQGLGPAPTGPIGSLPTTGYSPLSGTEGPRTPVNYRPDVSGGGTFDNATGKGGVGNLGTSTPGAWYRNIPQTAFSDFISPENQDWFRREWATTHGLGETTERSLGAFSPVAQYWLAALGQDRKFGPGAKAAPQAEADLMGNLYGRLLGKQTGYIDPQHIMREVVNSVWNANKPGQNDYIANMISNPSLSADDQVTNFWNFVSGTVGRLMPSDTMSSYKNLVEREGNLFKDFMAKNPTISMTFNKWVQQRLGPTGGL